MGCRRVVQADDRAAMGRVLAVEVKGGADGAVPGARTLRINNGRLIVIAGSGSARCCTVSIGCVATAGWSWRPARPTANGSASTRES